MGFFDKLFEKKAKANLTLNWQYNQPKWNTQKDKQFITEGYNSIVWVYAAVSLLSSCGSSVPWKLFRKQRSGKLIEITEHPILNIVNNRVNDYMTSKDFFDIWITSLALNGKFFAELDNHNYPTQLFQLYSYLVKPIPNKKTFIGGFEYELDEKVIFKANEILWSKFNNPLDAYDGLSPIKSMARTIDSENAGIEWNKSTLENSAVPVGAIKINGLITEDQRIRIKDDWIKKYSGSNNGRVPLILEGEKVDYVNFGMSAVDMDFLEQRKLNREEILAGFGVPPNCVGILEHATYSNYEQALRALWENTIIPRYLENIKNTLNKELCNRYADNLVLSYDLSGIAAVKESQDKLSARSRELFTTGIITRNEARRMIGFEELDDEDGDLFYNETEPQPDTSDSSQNGSKNDSNNKDGNSFKDKEEE